MTARFFSRYTVFILLGFSQCAFGLFNAVERKAIDAFECPTGWFLHNERCYGYGIYTTNFQQAREYCQDFGGDLAVAQDQRTYQWIGNSLGWQHCWIGIIKVPSVASNYYEWLDGTPITDVNGAKTWNPYTKWSGTEPDTATYDCVYLNSNQHAYDVSCTNAYKPLCQTVAKSRMQSSRECFQANRVRDKGITIPVFGLNGKGMTQEACSYACQNNEHYPANEYGFAVGEACFCVERTDDNICPDDHELANGGPMYADAESSLNEYAIEIEHNPYTCPDFWSYFNRKCYRMQESGHNWWDQRTQCRNLGGDIVIFRDVQEFHYYRDEFMATWDTKFTRNNYGQSVWNGLYDASYCPSGWSTYEDHCYRKIGSYLYEEGREECAGWYMKADHWTLTNNQTELDWVYANIMGSDQNSWMGLKKGADGEYYYADGTKLSSTGFDAWSDTPGNHTCVRVGAKSWVTEPCDGVARATICKFQRYPDGTGAWYDGSFVNETYHAFHGTQPAGSTSQHCTYMNDNEFWYDSNCGTGRWALCQMNATFSNETDPVKAVETFDPLLVDITYRGGMASLDQTIEFGNTDTTEANYYKRKVKKAYTYSPVSHGTHPIYADTTFKGRKYEASVTVESYLSLRSAEMSCPLYVNTDEEIYCEINVLGTNVTAGMDFGDDRKFDVKIPDANTYVVGWNFSSMLKPDGTWSTVNFIGLILHDPIEYKGRLFAWEIHLEERGLIEFMVMRPGCDSGFVYCHISKSCIAEDVDCKVQVPWRAETCGGNKYGTGSTHCVNSAGDKVYTTHRWDSLKVKRYTFVKMVQRNFNKRNYHFVSLSEEETIDVLPGDFIAFYPRGARIAFSNGPTGAMCQVGYTTAHADVTGCSERSNYFWIRAHIARTTNFQVAQTYRVDGIFNVTASLTGFLTEQPLVASQEIKVIIPISGTNVTADSYIYKGVEQTVFVNDDHLGSTPTYTWNFGDGSDPETVNSTEIKHTFVISGTFNITLLTFNEVSNEVAFFTVIVQEGLVDLTLTRYDIVTPFGYPTKLDIDIKEGENVTWTIKWGEGNYTEVYLGPDGTGAQAITVNHTYGAPLTYYEATIMLFNQVSELTATFFFAVEVDIVNLQFVHSGPVVFGSIITLDFNWESGTGANFTSFLNGADHADFAVTEHQYKGQVFLKEADYQVIGFHNITVQAKNLLGARLANTSVWIDHRIQNLAIASNTSYVRVGEVAGLTMTMDFGSRMDMNISWGDGLYEEEDIDVQLAADEYLLAHSWAEPSFPSVSIDLVNPVSGASVTHEMTVQHPVEGLTLDTNSPIAILKGENGEMMLRINASSALSIPTDAFHNYTFGVDDYCGVTEPPTPWELCNSLLSVFDNVSQALDGECMDPVDWEGSYCGLNNYTFAIPMCQTISVNETEPHYCPCTLDDICVNTSTVQTTDGQECTFPYILNGSSYSECSQVELTNYTTNVNNTDANGTTTTEEVHSYYTTYICGIGSVAVDLNDTKTFGVCNMSTVGIKEVCSPDNTSEEFRALQCGYILRDGSPPDADPPCNSDAADGAIVDSMWDVLNVGTNYSDIDFFNYTDFGTYRVTLNISNFVSHLWWDFLIDVDQPVQDLTIFCDEYALLWNTTTMCHTNMTWGSRIYLNYTWRDEGENNVIPYEMEAENSYLHHFKWEGLYDVSVLANNTLGTWEAVISEPVIVQHDVKKAFIVTGEKYINLLTDPTRAVEVVFDLLIANDTLFPTNASYAITFGDGGTEVGRLTGHIRTVHGKRCAFSGVEECTRESEDDPPSCPVGDGSVIQECVPRSSGYIYSTDGNSDGARCIFPSIYDGKTVNSCFDRNTTDSVAEFICPTTSNFDEDGKWGLCDPADFGEHQPDRDIPGYYHVMRFTHVYREGDSYNTTVSIFNMVSEEEFSYEHIVYDGISGLVKDIVWIDYDWLTGDEIVMPAYDGEDRVTKNYYPLEFELEFQANSSRGSHLTYTWDFGDGNSTTLYEEPNARHTYTEPTVYTVTLNVSNPLTWQIINKVIVVQRSVAKIGLSCVSPSPKNRTLEYAATAGEIGSDACYRIDFGDLLSDDSPILYAGNRSMCNHFFSSEMTAQLRYEPLTLAGLEDARNTTGDANFTISNIFQSIGAFNVKMRGLNFVSDVTSYWRTGITRGPCSWPSVDLKGPNACLSEDMCKSVRTDPTQRERTDVKIHYKSTRLIVSSSITLKCESTKIAWQQWEVTKMHANGTEEDITFPFGLNSTDLKILSIDPNYLDYGLYRFWLNVSMDQELNIENQDEVFILVDKTPLMGTVVGGFKVRTKWGENYTIDAIGDLTDPDDPTNKEGFTFKWLCRRLCEKWPVFDEDYNAVGEPAPSNCSTQDEGMGGCFRTGDYVVPGIFDNTTEGTLRRDLTYAYEPDQILMMIIAYRDTRTHVLEQYLDIINGDPPTMQTECVTNCKVKVNYAKRFSLKALITSGGNFNFNYQWILYRFPAGVTYIEEDEYVIHTDLWSQGVSTGIETASMSMDGATYFQESDVEYNFFFAVRAFRQFGNPNNYGETLFPFVINEAPLPGNCTSDRSNGTALEDEFTFSCPDDFIDPHKPFLYEIGWRNNPDNKFQWLTAGSDPAATALKIPAGLEDFEYSVQVAVQASDNIGGSTIVIVPIYVYPAESSEKVTNLLEDLVNGVGDLSDMCSSGDLNKISATLSALSSSIISSPSSTSSSAASSGSGGSVANQTVDDDTRERRSLDDTTASTTTMSAEQIEEERLRQEEEARLAQAQATKQREAMLDGLAKAPVSSLADATVVIGAAGNIASNPTQVSSDAQQTCLSMISKSLQVTAQENGETVLGADVIESVGEAMVKTLGSVSEASGAAAAGGDLAASATQSGINGAVKDLAGLVTGKKVPGESATIIGDDNLKVSITNMWADDLTKAPLGTGGNTISIGNTEDLVGSGNDTTATVVPTITVRKNNPFIQQNDTKAGTNTSTSPNSNVLHLTFTNSTGGPIEGVGGPQKRTHMTVSQPATQERNKVAGKAASYGSVMTIHETLIPAKSCVQSQLIRVAAPLNTTGDNETSSETTTMSTTVDLSSLSSTPTLTEVNGTDGFGRPIRFVVLMSINTRPSALRYFAKCELPLVLLKTETNRTYVEGGAILNEGCTLDSPNGTCKTAYFNSPPVVNDTAEEEQWEEMAGNWSSNATEDLSWQKDQFSSEEAMDNLDLSTCVMPHEFLNQTEDFSLFIGVTFLYTDEEGFENVTEATTPAAVSARRKRAVADSNNSTANATDEGVFYELDLVVSRCQYWVEDTQEWSSDGCEVGPESTPEKTHCICTILAPPAPASYNESEPGNDPEDDDKYSACARASKGLTLGAGIVIPMNTINLKNSAFNNLDDNPLVFSVMVSCMCLYLCVLIWAKKADLDDAKKAGASPLLDNDPRDKYIYEVTIFTGSRSRSGTTAKVSVVFCGEEDETPPRLIFDDKRPVLRRGGVDSFIMAVPRPLGVFSHIRVWHDNSGPSPSWYFSRMQVINMQTMEKYFFILDRWLAVDEDDGVIDRIIPLAGKEELTSFNHLFFTKAKRDLYDGHIWFSVFARPHKNTFTRCQRLTCCLSLLFCTMTGNILFYNTDGTDSGPSQTIFGIKISLTTLLTGLIASLMVFPINLVIIFVFKLAKERVPSVKRQKTAEQIAKAELKQQAGFLDADAGLGSVMVGSRVSFNSLSAIKEQPKKTKVKQPFKFQLPWWFIYIAYFLCVCTVGVSFWVTVEIAGTFGPEKSEGWMIAFVASITESIFMSQPIKVLFLALFWALVIKKPPAEDGDPGLEKNEVYLHTNNKVAGARPAKFRRHMGKYRKIPLPPTEEFLVAARRQRLKEMEMWGVMREILFYILFLYLLMMVSYGNKDPWSGTVYQNLKQEFSNGMYADEVSIESTTEYKSFWEWTKSTLVPSIYGGPMYNGETYEWQKGFTVDQNMFLVGVPRLRQMRSVSEKCVMPIYKYEQVCNPDYSLFGEDEAKYRKKWVKVNESDPTDQPDEGWFWQSTSDLKGFPYPGQIASYGGGGYAIELGHKSIDAEAKIENLIEDGWLNKDTRAVFVEFVLYNPNMNLFAVSFIIFEFMSTGAVQPTFEMQLLKLDRYIGTYMLAVLIAEIGTLLFIVIFIVKEIKLFRKRKSRYFKEFWNMIEFVTLLLCVLAMALFFYRFYIAHVTSAEFRLSKYKYMNFMMAAYWDSLYGYILAFIIFMANIKFLKLLRFNNKINSLGETLAYIAGSLSSFLFALFIVFLAFVQMSYVVFARALLSFSTFAKAFFTLFTLMLNKFDYQELEQANPVFAPLIFFSFTIIVIFVFVNFMLTIILEGFAIISEQNRNKPNEYEIVDFMVGQLKGVLGMGAGKKMPQMRNEADGFVAETHEDLMAKFEEFEEKFRDFYEEEAQGSEKEAIEKCEQQIKKQRIKRQARTIYTT